MGQPSHIFDYDKIDSKQILIRRANKNEKIKTLDEETRFLSAAELLITNGKKPIAIAGIMGGLSTSVNDKSSTLLIECAYFNPPVIRKGAKNLGMSTEASKRFERGADPDGTEKAMWRIIQLLEDVANGVWIPGIVDLYPKKIKQDSIKLRRLKLDILSGCKIPDEAVKESLTNLGCTVKKNDGEWICKPPSWRPDIKREVDLIEEVVRLYGYDNIPSNLNYQGIMNDGIIDPHRSLSKIINILTGFGFNQIFSNSLQSSRKISALNFKSVKMLNPLSDKMSEMRTSLFQGLLDTANFNFKNGNHDMMLFEWGNVFEQEAEGLEGIKEKLYLSGLAHGFYLKSSVHSDESLPASFHLIKGIVGALFSRLKINDINYDKFEDISIGLEDTHTVKVDSEIIGYIGKLSSKFDNLLNLAIGESYGFQFDLIQLMKLADIKNEYKPVVVYPSMIRDLNFVLDETIPVGEIIHVINKNGKNILIDSEPVSIFRDSSIGDNNKAVAINLIFQSSKKTLEDKDVNPVINEIIRVVSKKFSAKLR
jgi:phenylalanyl-tRNA synthetase beta chain